MLLACLAFSSLTVFDALLGFDARPSFLPDDDDGNALYLMICDSLWPTICLTLVIQYMCDPAHPMTPVKFLTSLAASAFRAAPAFGGGSAYASGYVRRAKRAQKMRAGEGGGEWGGRGYKWNNPQAPTSLLVPWNNPLTPTSLVARRYIGDGIMVPLFISFMCFRRCQVVVSSFSHEKQRDLVERLIPTVSFSTTAMLLFLIGESMACIQEKLGDGIEDNTAECKDVVAANAGFSFVFAVCGGVQLVLIPFKTVNYSMINVLRFNFEFGEQVRARARDRASVRTLAAAAGPSAAGAPRAKLRGVEEESGEREAALSGASVMEVVVSRANPCGCGGSLSRWGSMSEAAWSRGRERRARGSLVRRERDRGGRARQLCPSRTWLRRAPQPLGLASRVRRERDGGGRLALAPSTAGKQPC
jgi:hypothetical protein